MNNGRYYKLTKDPLIFVLAEFRFTEIMNIQKYVDQIQDKLRESFPYLDKLSTQEVSINNDGLSINTTPQWAFIGKNKANAIVLDHKRLVFVTSNYQRFDEFRSYCEGALGILLECAKPTLLTRLGLRYTDLIVSENETSVTNYVHSNFLKNPCLENVGEFSLQTNESIIKTDEGLMIIRSMYGNNAMSTWHDIDSLPVRIKTQEIASERVLLDFDHVWQSNVEAINQKDSDDPLEFDLAIILDKLERMHEISRKAFWDSTTEEAREVWK